MPLREETAQTAGDRRHVRREVRARRPGLSPRLLWRAYRFLRPYWRTTAGAYLLILFIAALSMAIPQLIRWIVDVVVSGAAVEGGPLVMAIGALLGITLLKGAFTYFQGQWSEMVSQNVAADLRNEIQRQLTELSFSYHDRAESGQILSRALQDVERIRFLTGRLVLRIVEALVLGLATVAVLLWMSPRLALLALVTLPLITVIAIRFAARFRPLSLAIQDQLAVLTTRLEQNLRGARVVKAFAQEPAEIGRFDDDNERWFALAAYAAELQAANIPLLDLVANLGLVLVLWYGGLLVIRDQATLGELVAFTTYLGQLAHPVRRLGLVIPALAMASSAAERIFAILDTPPAVQEEAGAVPLDAETTRGEIRFEAVSFAYEEGPPVLEQIDLSARPGQIIALLGATGAGKSTIISLIPRLYDPAAGRVTIDGQDLRTVQLASLRRQIGIVLQETTLFAATVRQNIAYGRPGASQAEIEAAARAAEAHDFITRDLVHGYDTVVGEQGATLSGGQKQRLAIARALITDPRILILDDATASVDVGTERRIQQALDRLMEGRTTFVIAHRLSTVRRADEILLLERGRIVARGNHGELLRRSPHYREIVRRQWQPLQEEEAGALAGAGADGDRAAEEGEG